MPIVYEDLIQNIHDSILPALKDLITEPLNPDIAASNAAHLVAASIVNAAVEAQKQGIKDPP